MCPRIAFLQSPIPLHRSKSPPRSSFLSSRLPTFPVPLPIPVHVRKNVPFSPIASSEKPSESPPPSESSPSRTLFGRVIVEILSLIVGALLLLLALVWRTSYIISQAVWRSLVWLSNVRRLCIWAVHRLSYVSSVTLPVASVGSLLRNVYGLAFDRLFRLGYKEEDSLNVIVRDVPEKKQTSSADVGTRLVLLRHAKTVWDREKDTPDHDRMLSIQGKDEARVIGAELSRLGWIPDVVLCSDAVRTVQTLSLLGIPDDGSMQTTCMDSLYYAVTGDEMALAVSDALAEKSLVENPTLLVVCHNPGCEELVEQLCGHRPKMGTGCAALLDFNYQQDSYAADESQPFRLSEQESRWSLVQLLQPSVLSSPESSSQE